MNASHADWLRDAGNVRDASKGWCNAPPALKAEAYLAYLGALDEEEGAASRYALAMADMERRAEG